MRLRQFSLVVLLLVSCQKPTSPTVQPERRATSAPPRASTAAPPDAPSAPPEGVRGHDLCAQDEPLTDEAEALGLRAHITGDGATRTVRYDRTDVFLRVQGTPLAPETTSGALTLALRGPSVVQRDRAMPLHVSFRNTGASPVTVVRCNDGSYEHLREPFIDLYAENLATHTTYRAAYVGGRCGVVNALVDGDLLTIAPQTESDAPAGTWARHLGESKIPTPGRYRVWVVYRMCSFARARGESTSTVAARPDWFLGRASSNAIDVTVR